MALLTWPLTIFPSSGPAPNPCAYNTQTIVTYKQISVYSVSSLEIL